MPKCALFITFNYWHLAKFDQIMCSSLYCRVDVCVQEARCYGALGWSVIIVGFSGHSNYLF